MKSLKKMAIEHANEMDIKLNNEEFDSYFYCKKHVYIHMKYAILMFQYYLKIVTHRKLFYIISMTCNIAYLLAAIYLIATSNTSIVLSSLLLLFMIITDILVLTSTKFLNKLCRKLGENADEESITEVFNNEVLDIANKIYNVFLYDFSVLRYRNWKKLKKANKESYNKIRTDIVGGQCYRITYYIANKVADSNIKIVWLIGKDNLTGEKFGHAVLRRGNRIYDTNERRTYDAHKYMKANGNYVFREFSIDEYLDCPTRRKEMQIVDWFTSNEIMVSAWNDFYYYCENNGAKRSTQD